MGNTCACIRFGSCFPFSEGWPIESVVEDRIERSKGHWSELIETESDLDDDEVAQENREVFEELQSHPTWGFFFMTFGYETKVMKAFGEMEVGEKFAEGGQAELFHAKVTWHPLVSKHMLKSEDGWVLEVFKKGTRVLKLRDQWPKEYLEWWAEDKKRWYLNLAPSTKYACEVFCGTLLEDGRFAFLLGKEHEDLRSCIDEDRGQFSKDEVERIMFNVARGMHWLHSENIVHRDLKAANVLVFREVGYSPEYYVADFECSVGVVGTGFFRAPEILRAIEEKTISKNPEVFSKEADVYSYGMTCYEVLTGKLPFQGRPNSDSNLVINGLRPKIPNHVDKWIRKLMKRCWDGDRSKRPSFVEIMEIILSNSAAVRSFQRGVEEWEKERIRIHEETLVQQGLVELE